MKIHVCWLASGILLLFGSLLLAQTATNGPGQPPQESLMDAYPNLQWAVPMVATMIVAGFRMLYRKFETRFSRNLLPYLCVIVATVLLFALDSTKHMTVPVWLAGPILGAIGIGARELLVRGMALLGGEDKSDPLAPLPPAPTPKP